MTTLSEINPNRIANNVEPAYPTHPGSILKDEIEYRGSLQVSYNMREARKDKSFMQKLAEIRKVAAML